MLQTFLLWVLHSGPVACPPEIGHIRWDGFRHTFAAGARYELLGTLWDRDRNGQPSAGDLFKAEGAVRNGRETGIGEVWFLLGPGLGSSFAQGFGKQQDELRASCESRFDVGKDLPTLKTPAALAAHLDALSAPDGARPASPEDALAAEMGAWADEICKGARHTSQTALEAELERRAKAAGTRVKPKAVRGVARDVASRYSIACARLDQGTLDAPR